MDNIVTFLVGVAAGIAWYRLHIFYILERFTHTTCDYCEFQIKQEKLSPGMRTSYEKRIRDRLHGLQDGVERIVQGRIPKTGIHLFPLPVRPKMTQVAKWFFGNRAAAPILSVAMIGCVYQYCAALAYIERGGKAAYGGECLAALAAGSLVWKMVSVWNRR